MSPESSNLAAFCEAWGTPAEVVQLTTQPLPEPAADQVLVRMLAAPINPADINLIEGKYGILPDLPATIGNEGVGVVTAVGPEVHGLKPGDRVRPMPGVGSFRQALAARETELQRLPMTLAIDDAATLSVNPATALRMLRDFVSLKPGDWVAQNGATTEVGRHIIRLCRHQGVRTLNLVRRKESIPELLDLGADVVVTEETRLHREINRLCDGALPRLGINTVGGQSAGNLAGILAPGGTLVTYGALGKQPLLVPNGPLIFRELRLAGFWVTAWYQRAGAEAAAAMFDELAGLFAAGVLRTRVEARYPLRDIHAALAHAQREGRSGKVMLDLNRSEDLT